MVRGEHSWCGPSLGLSSQVLPNLALLRERQWILDFLHQDDRLRRDRANAAVHQSIAGTNHVRLAVARADDGDPRAAALDDAAHDELVDHDARHAFRPLSFAAWLRIR